MSDGKRSYEFKVSKEFSGQRLDKVLTELLAPQFKFSRRFVRALIDQGAVYVGKNRERKLGRLIQENDLLRCWLTAEPGESKAVERLELQDGQILFEDDVLLFINKPAGLPSQATLDNGRDNLFAMVQRWRRKCGPDDYVGMHQRLDRDTSGVIFFTKSLKVNAKMAAQVAGHQMQKSYLALAALEAETLPPAEFRIRNHLAKKTGKIKRMHSVSSGGDLAETNFYLLKTQTPWLWINAQPRTGRMHQIRVHLAESRLPIVGDSMYGFGLGRKKASRLMLHASSLALEHPLHGGELTVEAPLPADFLETWDQLCRL